jgi:hypothetical protein
VLLAELAESRVRHPRHRREVERETVLEPREHARSVARTVPAGHRMFDDRDSSRARHLRHRRGRKNVTSRGGGGIGIGFHERSRTHRLEICSPGHPCPPSITRAPRPCGRLSTTLGTTSSTATKSTIAARWDHCTPMQSPLRLSRCPPNRDSLSLLEHRGAAHSSFFLHHSAVLHPSLPDARPHSDRFRCGGRESKFLADRQSPSRNPKAFRAATVPANHQLMRSPVVQPQPL